MRSGADSGRGACLLIGLGARPALERLLRRSDGRPVVVLVKPAEQALWQDCETITAEFRADAQKMEFRKGCFSPEFLDKVRAMRFDRVIVPSFAPTTWRDNALEVLAAELAGTVEAAPLNGRPARVYTGETLHRLAYNKAYMSGMLAVVPGVDGQNVLEVGCSDGLACDMIAQLGAAKVCGVDLWTENVGSEFASAVTEFRRCDATRLPYADESFELSFSIATFEHVREPWAVLAEMARVTKVGGCVFVQAGPLYHSPFGHHMFECFKEIPWAHLRFPAEQLVSMVRQNSQAVAVARARGCTPEQYVHGMLGRDHINGLALPEYRLAEFAASVGAEVLKLSTSYEGREALTSEIKAELSRFEPERLIEHGFEFCFRRTR